MCRTTTSEMKYVQLFWQKKKSSALMRSILYSRIMILFSFQFKTTKLSRRLFIKLFANCLIEMIIAREIDKRWRRTECPWLLYPSTKYNQLSVVYIFSFSYDCAIFRSFFNIIFFVPPFFFVDKRIEFDETSVWDKHHQRVAYTH